MGLLAGVFLAIGSLNVQTTRAARSSELNSDWVTVSSAVGMILKDPVLCNRALANKFLDLAQFPNNLENITLPGGDIARVGYPAVGMQISGIDIDKVLQMDIEVNGFFHRHLLNLRLRGRNVAGGGPLPGNNLYQKDFVVGVWQDVKYRRIASCF